MTQLTRQQIYDQIKASSKEEFILSEMQRLGYWQAATQPTPAESLLRRKADLQRQINALSEQIRDPEAALKAIHQERMAAARQRRIDTKIKHEVARYQRAQAWHAQQQSQLRYLGDLAGFKAAGPEAVSDVAALRAPGLPVLHHADELATAMGITLHELRFLSYSNRISRIRHYQHFALAKKSGGTRLISAPMPRLKRLQYWILDNILARLPLTDPAHGFVTGRNIVSNARPHVGQKVVINLDVQDFFPTITYPRIQGLFASLGYNREVASLLALLCSEPETHTVELDGQRYYLSQAPRRLPQGAPTSPYLSNLICRTLDRRLQGLATQQGFHYTRYADDLTLSGPHRSAVPALLHWTRATVAAEGFTLHPRKTRIMHQGRRQEVTGIVVNQQLSLDRKVLHRFRALLFQLDKDGYAGKQWGQGQDLLANIKSYAHYVRMVDPSKGERFLAQIAAIQHKHGKPRMPQLGITRFTPGATFRTRSAAGQLPLPTQLVAQAKPAPQLEQLIQHRELLPQVQAALGLVPPAADTVSPPAGPAPESPPAAKPPAETAPSPAAASEAIPDAVRQGLIETLLNLLRGKP